MEEKEKSAIPSWVWILVVITIIVVFVSIAGIQLWLSGYFDDPEQIPMSEVTSLIKQELS